MGKMRNVRPTYKFFQIYFTQFHVNEMESRIWFERPMVENMDDIRVSAIAQLANGTDFVVDIHFGYPGEFPYQLPRKVLTSESAHITNLGGS